MRVELSARVRWEWDRRMGRVGVPVGKLTKKQTLSAILSELLKVRRDMATLNEAVADLQAAVAGVLDRVGPTVEALKAQVAAGAQALADFDAADKTEDAAYEAAIAALQVALQEQVNAAADAAAQIEGSVATLNTVAVAVPEPGPEGEPVPGPEVPGGEVVPVEDAAAG